jgi:hypothetical protein
MKPATFHSVMAALALLVVGPPAWVASDREPPWVRLHGTIEPTHAGGKLIAHWHTTPLKRACPGTLQIEIISGRLIWPVLQRPVNDQLVVGQTDYTPPAWPLSRDVPPGPAMYRVTSFWTCNWLQNYLDWPVVQVGPELPFIVLPEEKK